MINFNLIADPKLRALVQGSPTLMSLPDEQLQQLIIRFSQLDTIGKEGMITLLEQQEKETAQRRNETEEQISLMENVTAKVIGAERHLDRLVRQQKEKPEETANQNQAENLLGQL